jgi:hypothetical protein
MIVLLQHDKVRSDVLLRCRPVFGKQQRRLMLVVLVTVMYSYVWLLLMAAITAGW